MKFGIRLQLLLALGGLLVLAFVPLFFAVASLTRTTLQNARELQARSLGRAVAAHVAEVRAGRDEARLKVLLQTEIGAGALSAIAVYSAEGRLMDRAGASEDLEALPLQVPVEMERTRTVHTSHGRALEVLVPASSGPVLALLRTDDEAVRSGPLVRLVAMYTGVFALALLVFAYMALTRMILRPIDQLSSAAQAVAQGGRTLAVPINAPRELAELGASLSDMTRKLREEEEALRSKVLELERKTEELRGAQRTLVRSERLASVGRLAAGLAHEIGNPISAILGFEELLLGGDIEPADQRDFLERMKKETERVSGVLRKLLDFARPAAALSKSADPPVPGSVHDAVRDACSLVRPQRAMRSLELTVEVEQTLPPVKLPTSELMQVLVNLLFNAADALQAKGTIWVRARVVQSSCLGPDGQCFVRIEVEDDGPGVEQEVRDSLFEPFVTTKEAGVGTGLGLAICRGLVEAAGGTILLEDKTDKGALFVIELPAA